VVGIDASEDRIRDASAQTLGLPRSVDFRVGDAYALPFEDETFDACRADRVFHHLVDPQKALAEMTRVTRAGGRIAVSDTDYDSLVVEAADGELTHRILQHHADRMECGRVGRKLPGLFLDAGLTSVTVTPYAAVATEYDEDVLKLRDKADRAAAAGVVGRADAERWVESLTEAAGAARFVCAQLVLTVSGRKA
jgi:ubiquinone/menaquinone biosynthesis C-methylase UbiE